MMNKLLKNILVLLTLFYLGTSIVSAQSSQPKQETLEGRVVAVNEERKEIRDGKEYLYQTLAVEITAGSIKGESITIESGDIPLVYQRNYQTGDELLISFTQDPDGNNIFYIVDVVRRKALGLLFLLFALFAVVIGGIRGIFSLIGLLISFIVIFTLILPFINAGYNPILVAIGGSFVIALATFYLSHGVNKKTTVAIVGTLLALLVTGLLAQVFTQLSALTGFTSDEVSFLTLAKGQSFNIKGILLAGIIIGSLGILDDITISQAAVVEQLKDANPKISHRELFWRSMEVGRDHIASLVNTLVLVYTGSSLPLLLLFLDSSRTFAEVVNYEPIAEEIIRTLVGSIGLILAVPLTTIIAVKVLGRAKGG